MTASDVRRLALWVALAALVAHLGLSVGGVWAMDAISYDDPQVIELVQNASVADLLTTPQWFAYKPIYFLSLKFDALFGDGMVAVAHVVNLLLHALAVFLLVRLLHDIFGSRWIAAGVGLLFAVHPVHVENVAWLSERKDTLSLVFVLLAHLSFRARRARGETVMWVPALLLLLGGLTKGTVWSYAGVLLVDALLGQPAPAPRRGLVVRSLTPVFVVALGGVALDFTVAMQSGAAGVEHGVTTLALAAAMAGVHARYLWNLVAPAGLSLDYAIDPGGSWASPLAWAGVLLAVLAVAALVIGIRRRRPFLALAAAFWVFGLAPVNNVLPRTAALMADRYLYVPAVGFYLLVVVLLARAGRSRVAILGTAVVALAVLCEVRTATFADTQRVWTDAIEKTPESALAYLHRGRDAAAEGRYASAQQDADRALAANPRPELRVKAHLLRCAALLGQGGDDELLEEANTAARYARSLASNAMVQGDPKGVQSQAEIFRGQALERLGHTVAAIDAYRRAVLLDDDSWSAHYNYGTLLAATRHEDGLDEALGELRRAHDLNPGYLEAALQVATVYGRMGDKPRALAVLDQAESRHGRKADLLYARATLHLQVGNEWAEARKLLRELRDLEPNHPKGKHLEADISVAIGRAHLRRGRAERDGDLFRKAIGHFDDAVKVDPDHWEAHLLAGDALAERGLYREARERYRQARRLVPRERWLDGVIARTGALEAARIAERAESPADVERAAGIMAGVVRLQVPRLDLGFSPLEEELELLRQLADVLEGGQHPEADHAASLLSAAARLVTGDDIGALLELQAAFGRFGTVERERVVLDAALLLRAMLYMRQGDFEAARADYERLAERRPDDSLPALRLLQIDLRAAQARYQIALGDRGDPQHGARARAAVDAVANRIRAFADEHPESATAGLLAVQAEMNLERWIDALRRLNGMAQRHPQNASVYRGYNMVYVAEYTKRRDRALIREASRALDKAMALDRRDVRTLMDASQTARVAGDLASAVRHAERARSLESYDGGPATRLLVDLHLALGRKALEGGAVETVQKAIKAARLVDPSRAGSWILEGDLKLKTPRLTRFRDAYELALKAKELEPYNRDADRLLAECHRGSGFAAKLKRGGYRVPQPGSKGWEAWQALTEDERAKAAAAIERTRAALQKQAIHDYEQALMLDPDGEHAAEDRREIASLRRSDPASERQRRQDAQAAYDSAWAHETKGEMVDALYAYRDAARLWSGFARAQAKLLEVATNLVIGMPLDLPDARETADKYVGMAFGALHALGSLDVRGRFTLLWYFRGRLNEWLYRSRPDVDPAAREVSRLAAIRGFDTFLQRTRADPEAEQDSAEVRYARASVKRLREKD